MKKIKILIKIVKALLTDGELTYSFFKNIFSILLLRIKFSFKTKSLKIVVLTEHLGDIVAAEPVSRYLRSKFPGSYICWITNKKYREVIDTNPYVNRAIPVSCLTEWILLKHFFKKRNVYDLHIKNSVCERHLLVDANNNNSDITLDNYYEKGNLLFAFSRSAGIEMPATTAPQLYLKKQFPAIEGSYIVMHTSSNHKNKMWSTLCWNQLSNFLLEKSEKYLIVEIGFEKIITIQNIRLVDMTGSRKLSAIAGLIEKSTLFIGIDSSFAHFANALNKDSLILIGDFYNFKEYMPYSGMFQFNKVKTIIYHPEPLITLPCIQVITAANEKLNSIEK